MGKKTGALIKEARTSAGMTQEQLAKKIPGIAASDISKAERGEAELTQAVLKQIAKETGITQSSLLNAEKPAAKTAAKSTGTKTASKTTTAKSTAKTSTAKSASKSTTKTAKAKDDDMELTAAEKKLVELYRAADSDTKKATISLLKGEKNEMQQLMSNLLGGTLSKFLK